MKACPFCAQMIQDEAVKCRHCGGWLNKEEEARLAEAAAVGSKLLAVKIYSYLLLVQAALYGLGMIIVLIARGSGLSGSFGPTGLVFVLLILGIDGLLIFVALGLLKNQRVAYILNIVLLALGLIGGLLMLVLLRIPNNGTGAAGAPGQGQVLSVSLSLIILTGAWLAYFISKKRLFPKRVAVELSPNNP
jgi:hypothetical protein